MLRDSSDTELPEPPPDEAAQAASIWLAKINRGLRPDEVAELRAWLKVARHRHVVLDMGRLYHGPEVVGVLSELFPAGPEPVKSDALRVFARAALIVSVVAGVVFICATGRLPIANEWVPRWVAMHRSCDAPNSETTAATRGMYSTAVGGRRELTLPDQSTVTLNTNTCMAVNYGPTTRTIRLPYGEATFHVVPDRNRPFYVRAGHNRTFQSIGTDFNVRVLSPDHVELTVAEGNVRVIYSQDLLAETPAQLRLQDHRTFDDTTVSALHTALVEPGMQFVRKLEVGDLHTLLAWQQGLIFFDGATLSDALAEVDRYTTTRFVLADQRLRNIRIGGQFRTGDVSGLLASLRKDFMIDSRRDAQGRVVLSALGQLPRT